MLSNDVNLSVFTFFVINTILLAFLAFVYLRQRSKNNKQQQLFGLGLALTSIAFLFWTYIVGFHPDSIGLITGVGVIFFISGLASFYLSLVSTLAAAARAKAYVTGFLVLGALVALRFIFYKSNPGFSDDGFFSFNTNQVVLYAYVVVMSLTIMPAAYALAERVKNSKLKGIIRFGFTLVVISTAILITSPDNYLQTVNGIGMTSAFVLLVVGHMLYSPNNKQ